MSGKEPPLSPHVRRSTLITAVILLVFAPSALAGRWMYATDGPGNRIFAFSLAADGSVSWATQPLPNQTAPTALAMSPTAGTLYATLSGGPRPYAADASIGGLTAGTPASAGTGPAAVAISPSGMQLYVANSGSDSISRYAIGAAGALPASPSATTSVGSGTHPSAIAMTPDGHYLYVADAGTGAISGYSVNTLTGDLTSLGDPVAVGTAASAPSALAMAASGSYLYASLKGDNAVAALMIDATTGALTQLTGSPYASGTGPIGVAVTTDGGRLLVANSGDGTVARFLVSGGIPTRLSSTGDPTVAGAQSVAVTLDGKHAYVGGSSSLAAFDVSSTAAMTARGNPQATNASHAAIAIAPDQGPIARVNPQPAPATMQSQFQGGPSLDPDSSVASWNWDFGDGTTGTGDTPTHVYANPGTYTVTLTVADSEGCSSTPVYTGQQLACEPSGYATWSQQITIPPAPDNTPPDQTCAHDGDDGFCGTPDRKAPQVTVLGFNDGAQINDVDAPTELVGSITPDPSGIQNVQLRFKKAAGTIVAKKTVTKRVCRKVKVKGKKRRVCKKRRVVKKTNTKVAACLTVSGTKNYLVRYQCSKVPWVSVTQGDGTFRYDLPVALGLGSYTVDVIAVDGVGNTDVLEKGRNDMSFQVIKTPANGGTGGGTTTTPTGGTTSPPPDDTGSPFGH